MRGLPSRGTRARTLLGLGTLGSVLAGGWERDAGAGEALASTWRTTAGVGRRKGTMSLLTAVEGPKRLLGFLVRVLFDAPRERG
jgi:hypothetical protein